MNEFDLSIGAKVHCLDGEGGNLVKVVINPQTSHVTDLIIEKGFLFKKDRVIPMSAVNQADNQGIYLSIRSDLLETYPEYRVIEIEEPDPAGQSASTSMAYGGAPDRVMTIRRQIRRGVADGLVIVGQGTAVKNIEGQIGTLDHLLVDSLSSEVTHVIARQGTLFATHLRIPMSLVQEIDDELIFLVGSDESLMQLTRFAPQDDEAVEAKVRARFNEARLLTDDVSIIVSDGTLYLSGVVAHESAKAALERVARSVEGITDVKNDLEVSVYIGTPVDLVAHVAAALMRDRQTGKANIDVVNENGTITLIGEVNSANTREAAEAIAGRQPGVISVINSLKVKTD